MTLPEVYRVDMEIHTDIQLETPMIKSEEKCESKLVWDMALLYDTPTPLQTNAQAQPMTEQKVSSPDRTIIGKLIPITPASRRETLKCELVRKETPTYTDSICRPLLNCLISKIV